MATTSITKSIRIRTRKEAHALIRALEDAEENAIECKPLNRPCKEIKGKDIKRFFNNNSEVDR